MSNLDCCFGELKILVSNKRIMWKFYLWVIPFFMLNGDSQAIIRTKREDLCRLRSGLTGQCKKLAECYPAVYDLYVYGKWPSYCAFTGYELIVCCDEYSTATNSPPSDVQDADLPISSTTNAPTINPRTTTQDTRKTTGLSDEEAIEISKQKCAEYSKIVKNDFNPELLVIGGKPACESEFPHMVHLGYGAEDIEFKCGASLISEEFLLTAAHCIEAGDGSPVTVAKIGTGDKRFEINATIKEIIPHPLWNPSNRYHDIALFRLAKPIVDLETEFDNHTRPGCLQTVKDIEEKQGEATGWGATSQYGEGSEALLKVKLEFLHHSQCSKTYRKRKDLNVGIDDDSMLCAGGYDTGKDTCPGDSGGPLQVYRSERLNQKYEQHYYSIVGITSFGSHCGQAPGVYTRVSHYVPWIVSNVWPEELEYISKTKKNLETIDYRSSFSASLFKKPK